MKELILNPTENLYPLLNETHKLKGLYIPQKKRNMDDRVIFAGRDKYTDIINGIYEKWNIKLNSGNITLALLSGLHASIVLFMSIGAIGNKVMILPPDAGGHFATRNILTRLGYIVSEFLVDYDNCCIDIEKSINYANEIKPDFIFIARSNCMQYEDFSWLNRIKCDNIKIFDASQYISGILTSRFISPYDMKFDIIISSLHKDFPGTQQALCAFSYNAKERGLDKMVLKEFSKYISSIHPAEIFNSVYFINNFEKLKQYEELKISNCEMLYHSLLKSDLSLQKKTFDKTATQQLWLKCSSRESAYSMFKQLEFIGILVNYMELPYNLGHGLRLGTGAASLQGLTPENCKQLTYFIIQCKENQCDGSLNTLRKAAQNFMSSFIKE